MIIIYAQNLSENIPQCMRQMLWYTDRGCYDFMGANIGLGVFVAEAGENRIAIHQVNNTHRLGTPGLLCMSQPQSYH